MMASGEASKGAGTLDPLLSRVAPALATVPGVRAVVLGGSRARGTATPGSDYDIGLYYRQGAPLNTVRLLEVVKGLVDDPGVASLTEVGGWGPWIVGGGWLRIGGTKVDLLYRCGEAVGEVIRDCQDGRVRIDYQPGHPHGFCSAIWMGEIALCRILADPDGMVADLKAMTSPYPERLREALIRRFLWEVLFSIDNARTAVPRGDQTHIAGCVYRALCCVAQVLFAVNRRYLVNEKGAQCEAAAFPFTIFGLTERTAEIWRALGVGAFNAALDNLIGVERELKATAAASN